MAIQYNTKVYCGGKKYNWKKVVMGAARWRYGLKSAAPNGNIEQAQKKNYRYTKLGKTTHAKNTKVNDWTKEEKYKSRWKKAWKN